MNYKTISSSSIGEFKDRGSKFFAYAFPAYSEEEWQLQLEAVKKEHFKARHHCFAFRLGLDKNNFRSNDDGEPSGTAGRPILGQIDSFGLTNVFIVVVRYFGGTKLGTSGLINAYRTSAQVALNNADIIEKSLDDIFQITFDYALMSEVMNTLKKIEIEMVSQDFGNIGKIKIAIPKSDLEEKMILIKAGIAKVRVEEVADLEEIEGVEIDYLFTR
jgi:uncharacterized YigZ family protein